MSKGYGKVQQGIIDTVATEPLGDDGLPPWLSIEDLSLHIYETDRPSASQREAIRRAAHRLAELEEIEVSKQTVDGWKEHSETFPAGTLFLCQISFMEKVSCEGCDMGLESTDQKGWDIACETHNTPKTRANCDQCLHEYCRPHYDAMTRYFEDKTTREHSADCASDDPCDWHRGILRHAIEKTNCTECRLEPCDSETPVGPLPVCDDCQLPRFTRAWLKWDYRATQEWIPDEPESHRRWKRHIKVHQWPTERTWTWHKPWITNNLAVRAPLDEDQQGFATYQFKRRKAQQSLAIAAIMSGQEPTVELPPDYKTVRGWKTHLPKWEEKREHQRRLKDAARLAI